jgi:hypothetical protein
MGLHERNGTIECHGAIHLVLENIGVVQTVRLGVGIVAAPRRC